MAIPDKDREAEERNRKLAAQIQELNYQRLGITHWEMVSAAEEQRRLDELEKNRDPEALIAYGEKAEFLVPGYYKIKSRGKPGQEILASEEEQSFHFKLDKNGNVSCVPNVSKERWPQACGLMLDLLAANGNDTSVINCDFNAKINSRDYRDKLFNRIVINMRQAHERGMAVEFAQGDKEPTGIQKLIDMLQPEQRDFLFAYRDTLTAHKKRNQILLGLKADFAKELAAIEGQPRLANPTDPAQVEDYKNNLFQGRDNNDAKVEAVAEELAKLEERLNACDALAKKVEQNFESQRLAINSFDKRNPNEKFNTALDSAEINKDLDRHLDKIDDRTGPSIVRTLDNLFGDHTNSKVKDTFIDKAYAQHHQSQGDRQQVYNVIEKERQDIAAKLKALKGWRTEDIKTQAEQKITNLKAEIEQKQNQERLPNQPRETLNQLKTDREALEKKVKNLERLVKLENAPSEVEQLKTEINNAPAADQPGLRQRLTEMLTNNPLLNALEGLIKKVQTLKNDDTTLSQALTQKQQVIDATKGNRPIQRF